MSKNDKNKFVFLESPIGLSIKIMFKFKYFIFLISFLFLANVAFAQNETTTTVPPASGEINQTVQSDENIKPQDLGAKDPKILPGNPLYAFKNLSRGIQSFFTFGPVEKAEKKLQFSNEKLLEAQKLAEQDKKPEILNQALENYKTETGKLKEEAQNIKETAKENEKVDKFLDKFIDQSLKQQKLLGKLEKDLPPDTYMALKNAKEGSLQQFSDVALKMASPENLQEKLTKVLDQQIGSQFKNFKNLEVLKEIEDKVPEQAKNAIKMAQENSLKGLQNDLSNMSPANQEEFNEYIKNIGGDGIRQIAIINDFGNQEIPKEMRDVMNMAKERTLEKIEGKIKDFTQDQQKEEFLKRLESGKMEDLRTLKELENNLSPETIDKVMEAKNQALKNFREDIEKGSPSEKQEELLKNMEEFHDVKQLEILKEIESIIPPEKKEFWNEMKTKLINEMKKDISGAKNAAEKQIQFEKMASDVPQYFNIVKEFGIPQEITTGVMKAQVEKLGNRIENTEDPARIQFLRQKIEEEEAIKQELESRNPEIFKKIDEQQQNFAEEITKDKASAQIEKAKQEIVAAEQEFSSLDDKTKNEVTERSPYRVLLANAQKKINVAKTAIENELYGEAFGMSTAAFYEANNARRIIKEIGLRREIFGNQDQERKNFEEQFFQEKNQIKTVSEKQFNEQFSGEKIPLPGEFKMEFLPQEKIFEQFNPAMPSQPGSPPNPNQEGGCFCIQVWDPVCGVDGKTYGNACEAKCANVQIIYSGSCGEKRQNTDMVPGGRECTSNTSCPQPACPPCPQEKCPPCPRFQCIEGKCVMEKTERDLKEMPCAREGEKINRNQMLGATNQRCCEGLMEIAVSPSYSVCGKDARTVKETEQPIGQPLERPNSNLPNPASALCQKMGYKLEIRTDENGGQYGVCIFPDKNECEEWKFFRGECGTQYKKEGVIPQESILTTPQGAEGEQINGPMEPREIGGCAQVITYRKEGDKCFVCPDACSLIEKCKEAEQKECQNMQSRPQNEMKTHESQNESPFQFFKDTIRDLIKPEENKEQMPMEKPNEQMKNPDIQSDKQLPIMPNKDLNPEMQINKPQPLNTNQNPPIMRPDQQPQINQPVQQQMQQPNQRPIQQLNQQPMNQPMQQPNQQLNQPPNQQPMQQPNQQPMPQQQMPPKPNL